MSHKNKIHNQKTYKIFRETYLYKKNNFHLHTYEEKIQFTAMYKIIHAAQKRNVIKIFAFINLYINSNFTFTDLKH